MDTYICNHCGRNETEARPGTGPHAAGLWCRNCGRMIKWLPKAEAEKMLRAQKAFGSPPVQSALDLDV